MGATRVSAPDSHKPVVRKPPTSPTKAWQEALDQARHNAPRHYVDVRPGDNLSTIAATHQDTLSSVEAANPQITDPALIHVGDKVALPKKTPAQVVSGVDDAGVKPIITAMAHANASQTPQSWKEVSQATLRMLTANNHGPYPDVTGAAEVKQLDALEPGNSKFAAANKAALAAAQAQWRTMGVTKSQLQPLVNAYDHARQVTNTVNRSLRNPAVSRDPATVGKLDAAKQQANQALQAEIEKSLQSAGNQAARQAGPNPAAQATARSVAIDERAEDITMFGPKDPGFNAAVNNAAHDLQVTQPAQKVAAAYAHGGAAQAASVLKSETAAAGNPAIALQIIKASEPTINKTTRAMNDLVTGYGEPPEFQQIYGDLSSAVESATPTSLTMKADGQTMPSIDTTAAVIVGKSIAATAPRNLPPADLETFYQFAASDAVGGADGTSLTLATAAQLKQQGNDVAAAYLVAGAADGIQTLRSKIDGDLKNFGSTTANFNKIQTSWAKYTNQSQANHAINRLLAQNPSVRQKADNELAEISRDGDAVVEAESAWNTYQGQINGLRTQDTGDASKLMSTGIHSLTGDDDDAVVFSVSQSTRLNTAITKVTGSVVASTGTSGGWQSWPGWGTIRSTRSFLSASQKNVQKGSILPNKGSVQAHGFAATALSALGLGLTAEDVADENGFHWSTPTQAVYSIYAGLGFVKYSGETYTSLAKVNVLPKVAQFEIKGDSEATKILKAVVGTDSANLTNSPAFKTLGVFYYGVGALVSIGQAVGSANSDPLAAGFDAMQAVGNAGNAAKPLLSDLFGESFAEDAGFVSSGIGLVGALGAIGYQAYKSVSANDAYHAESAEYLQDALGINPKLAAILTNMPPSTFDALEQYAATYHVSPGHLLQELNKQWNEKKEINVNTFLFQASRMFPQSDGKYAKTQFLDHGERNTPSETLQIVRGDKIVTVPQPIDPQSLDQLHYWATVLFGNNQVG